MSTYFCPRARPQSLDECSSPSRPVIEIRVGQVAPSLNFRRVVSRHCRQGADFGGGVAGRVEVVWKRLVGRMKGYQENLI